MRTWGSYSAFRSYGSVVGRAKPTGPAFGRPDDRLRVPTDGRGLVGTARKSAPLPTRVIPVDRNPL